MDLSNIMQMAEQLRRQLGATHADAGNIRVVGEAGGGLVRVEMNGKHEVVEVHIDEKTSEAGDRGLLEDLVRAAVNQASSRVAAELKQRMTSLASSLGLDASLLDSFLKGP